LNLARLLFRQDGKHRIVKKRGQSEQLPEVAIRYHRRRGDLELPGFTNRSSVFDLSYQAAWDSHPARFDLESNPVLDRDL